MQYKAMQYETRRRPAAERADPWSYQATVARGLIKSLGGDEAARCARRQRWDGVLSLVLAETGVAGAGVALG